jgi:hypothetical protein
LYKSFQLGGHAIGEIDFINNCHFGKKQPKGGN